MQAMGGRKLGHGKLTGTEIKHAGERKLEIQYLGLFKEHEQD